MTPSPHTLAHLVEALGIGGVALAALVFFRNRVIRRRMIFTLTVLAGVAIVHAAGAFGALGRGADSVDAVEVIERLLITFCVINTFVALAFNPWFSDRVRDRAPAIVQDAIVIALFLGAVLIVYQQDATKMLATSAIAAAVLGFALQETLGNAFAGLAIQTEKPFRVGHWISVATYEGRVMEVTWRATKIRTKAGNLVVLPNNVVAREAINNYTEPTSPTRVMVEVGASYSASPNDVSAALLDVIRRSPFVLETPAPDVLLQEFAGSSINYRARFWINDFENEEAAKDRVRRGIYYEFSRRGIEIPYPIQVEYSREDTVEPADVRIARYAAIIGRVPVLAALFVEGRRALAESAVERLFGAGETIVREGSDGRSMFIVCRGVAVVIIGQGHEVARLKEGSYFGEMSLLTGDPRSATVKALEDCTVLEISADTFKEYVTTHPEVIDLLATAAVARRRELEQSRAAAAAALVPEAPLTLAARMRRFFGLT